MGVTLFYIFCHIPFIFRDLLFEGGYDLLFEGGYEDGTCSEHAFVGA